MDGREQYEKAPPQAKVCIDLMACGAGDQRWAYETAGYKGKSPAAAAKFAHDNRAAIAWREAQFRAERNDVLQAERDEQIKRSMRRARASLHGIVTLGPECGECGHGRLYVSLNDLTEEQMADIAEVSETAHGIKVKLHSPQPAEERLAKLGGFDQPSKVEITNFEEAARALGWEPEELRDGLEE